MSAEPRVTVFIPTYNRSKMLPKAIESILAQTFDDFELLIIDDGSTDDTPAVLARYDDPRIRLEPNPSNLGLPRTRNRAMQLARGEFLAYLDSDDLSEPERLARQVAFLEARPDVALVGCGKRTIGGVPGLGQRLRDRPLEPKAIQARLLFRVCIGNSSIMARTEAMRAFPYDETLPVCEDFDQFARMAETLKLANLPDKLLRKRRHSGSESRRRELVKECQKRILAGQLDRLGLRWDADDLELHFQLGRPASWHKPTADELPRAEAWLTRLAEANAATGRYDAAAFDRVLGEVWLELWFKALPGSALSCRRWFWRSSMAGCARRRLTARFGGMAGQA